MKEKLHKCEIWNKNEVKTKWKVHQGQGALESEHQCPGGQAGAGQKAPCPPGARMGERSGRQCATHER